MEPSSRVQEAVAQLVRLAEESDLVGVSVERDGLKVALRRSMYQEAVIDAVAEDVVPPEGTEAVAETAETPGHIVRSPLVGIFHRCAPGKDTPVADAGDSVTEGQTIGGGDPNRRRTAHHHIFDCAAKVFDISALNVFYDIGQKALVEEAHKPFRVPFHTFVQIRSPALSARD